MKFKITDFVWYVVLGAAICIISVGLLMIAFDVTGRNEDPVVSTEPEPTAIIHTAPPATPEPTETPEPEPEPEPETVYIYDVPLDAWLQIHIIQICEDYHIDPAIIMAMIERETNFRPDSKGDNGQSYGLMQIKIKYHRDRMDKLGIDDLMDPYQNVVVGIDYLGELLVKYEDIEVALMAYNAGPGGAYEYWWQYGIYSNAYSSGVLERARTFREGMMEYVLSD